MTITSEKISGKRFATVRRDGYDTDVVDQCLADMERALNDLEMKRSVLEEANGLLHEQLLRAQESLRAADEECASLRGALAVAPVAQDDPVRESSQSAVRLLEIAARDAELLVETARAQAGELLTEARQAAEQQRHEAERERAEIEARVSELVGLETSYRAGLSALLESHCEVLEGPSVHDAVIGRRADRPAGD